MNLKGWLIISLCLILVFLVGALGTAGCNPSKTDVLPQENETEGEDPVDQGMQLTLAMASPGGTWQAIAEGVAQAIRQQYPGSKVEVITGSIGGNPVSVQGKKATFALSHAPNAKLAIDGTPPYDSPNPDLMGLSSAYVGPLHFIVPADSPINSFNEIKEKQYPVKMSINSKGSTPEFLSEAIFNQYGITLEDVKSWGGEITYLSSGEAFALLLERVYNMGVTISYLPSTPVLELASGLEIKLLSLDDHVVDFLCQNYGTVRSVIPGGTYTFQDEDVITIGSPNIFIVHKDMPDEVAYKIVESMDKQRDYLNNVHETFKVLTLERMYKDMGGLPVHPGALKYYQENGIVD
ncbi:MAG: TAXI family TRAP transporter solute-binding subunit [Firmicutes bacterium]|nr:TAXI family TRAP transporter solute-binding subunit [Bacillota bacterium]